MDIYNLITKETVDRFIQDGEANLIVSSSLKPNQVNQDFTLLWRAKLPEDETQVILKEGTIIFDDLVEVQSIYKQYGK